MKTRGPRAPVTVTARMRTASLPPPATLPAVASWPKLRRHGQCDLTALRQDGLICNQNKRVREINERIEALDRLPAEHSRLLELEEA